MKRTAEKALSIIGLVFTALSVIGGFFFLLLVKGVTSDGEIMKEFELELSSDPAIPAGEVEAIMGFVDYLEGFGWLLVILLVISLIATIVGIVFIWKEKNPKLAGIMLIVGGLFAFILSLTSILLYIAGILCLTRKAPMIDEPAFDDERYGDTMRPL